MHRLKAVPGVCTFSCCSPRNVPCAPPLAEGAMARQSCDPRSSPRILTASPESRYDYGISKWQPKALGVLGKVPALRGEAPLLHSEFRLICTNSSPGPQGPGYLWWTAHAVHGSTNRWLSLYRDTHFTFSDSGWVAIPLSHRSPTK